MKQRETAEGVSRREFLKGSAAGAASVAAGAAGVALPEESDAQQNAPGRQAAPVPSEAALARESGPAPAAASRFIEHPASDFLVDVLKSLNFEYVAANPGSAFESLHESLINYGGNRAPELLTCLHEESAAGMAHGYAKIEGKPMLVLLHGTVGLMHGSMAIFNAYADRVPICLIAGNHQEPGGGVSGYHSAQDMGSLVRDYVKWDAESLTPEQFARTAVRGYQLAMTPPTGPVLFVADHDMMGRALPPNQRPSIPVLSPAAPPQGDTAALAETARLLLAAERPLIMTQRYARTSEGVARLVELAELLGSPVTGSERVDFPWKHPLYGRGGAGYVPDVTLALEVNDMYDVARSARARGGKSIGISAVELFHRSNIHDYGRYAELDLTIAADAEASLPALLEEVRSRITSAQRRAAQSRAERVAEAHRKERAAALAKARYGWNASPISIPRLCAEIWAQVRQDDWSLVSRQVFLSGWPGRIWDMKERYHYIGSSGGGGMGYGPPASVGAALANKKHGRLSINIQTDGDLNYAPGVLWTAVHHRIPLLTVMHNNRAYHAELMYIQQNCGLHKRGADRAGIGTTLENPFIDYAGMARSYGMYAEGPIGDPADLAPALGRALARVRAGEPALLDVLTEPR
ncbi:MAG TPA: thiamine pyrophosphate-binding protein [Gammaproteobacteria bacterium]|nr:thiamine pyrophosphate-binding protein [Gammaproteobacteria bacterium]